MFTKLRTIFTAKEVELRFTVEELMFLKHLVEENRYTRNEPFTSAQRGKLINKLMAVVQSKVRPK